MSTNLGVGDTQNTIGDSVPSHFDMVAQIRPSFHQACNLVLGASKNKRRKIGDD
jgi:hypothetical protein